MATDNTTALRNDPVRSTQILERIPAGRWDEPNDVAGAFGKQSWNDDQRGGSVNGITSRTW